MMRVILMLPATFMEPHLSPPLVDGLVLPRNGKILPEEEGCYLK